MQPRTYWGALLHTKGGRVGPVTWLWSKHPREAPADGAAMQAALFVSRSACRAWCREVNAELWAAGENRACRISPARVRVTLEVVR